MLFFSCFHKKKKKKKTIGEAMNGMGDGAGDVSGDGKLMGVLLLDDFDIEKSDDEEDDDSVVNELRYIFFLYRP